MKGKNGTSLETITKKRIYIRMRIATGHQYCVSVALDSQKVKMKESSMPENVNVTNDHRRKNEGNNERKVKRRTSFFRYIQH